VGQREIGPVSSAPRHLVDLYQQSKKGKSQKRDDMNVVANGEDVQMDENEDNPIDDSDIFGEL